MTAASIADDLFRREGARILASLVAHFGAHRLQLAEDVVQEALVRALQTWPYRGIPENPAAWLTQTAKNLALDAIRREQRWKPREEALAAEQDPWFSSVELDAEHEIADDTLRMLFVCAHPQLSEEMQIALALRTVCGLSAGEIAAAFFSTEAAIAKRLVRARQQIRDESIPWGVPEGLELETRLQVVMSIIYLLFNEGYKASSGPTLMREGLCREAIRLAGILAKHPATERPATHALLALLCLTAARFPARVDAQGCPLRLHEQDRTKWDRTLILRGMSHLQRASTGDAISAYHLEAGIAASHTVAVDDTATDWARILQLYEGLSLLKPTPVVFMNRAVAISKVRGPEAGLAALDALPGVAMLEPSAVFHMVRGEMCAKLGETTEALHHMRQAGILANVSAERRFIEARIGELVVGE